VLDTLNALSKPGDAAKTLREIRKRQKGETETGDETPASVPLTPEMAAQVFMAAIKASGDLAPEKAHALFLLTQEINTSWTESAVDAETQTAWFDEYQKSTQLGVAPHVGVKTDASEVPAQAELKEVAA
jgi:hypothetical protein